MSGGNGASEPVEPARRWYLLFTDEDGGVRGILGPFKDGQGDALDVQRVMLSADKLITTTIDFEDPDLRVPYLYHYISVVELSAEEIAGLEKRREETDDEDG
jgi:hypothetical protein